MYPDRELIGLALHRKILGRRIALRRGECTAAATRLARPIAWLDRALALWHRLPPLARFALPALGTMATRTLFPRRKLLHLFVRWAPLVTGAARGIRAMRAAASPPRR